MPAFQVALFKFKPDADPSDIQEWLAASNSMPDKIPCVRSLVAGKPAASFEHLAKGWDLAACVELESSESRTEFYEHPEHIHTRELCKRVCDLSQTVAIVFETGV